MNRFQTLLDKGLLFEKGNRLSVPSRRNFLQFSSLGLASSFLPSLAQGQTNSEGPKRFLSIRMVGGWDVSQFCVPTRPGISGAEVPKHSEIGPFPIVDNAFWPKTTYESYGIAYQNLVENFQDKMIQIDGVRSQAPVHGSSLSEQGTGNFRIGELDHNSSLIAESSPGFKKTAFPFMTNSERSERTNRVRTLQTLGSKSLFEMADARRELGLELMTQSGFELLQEIQTRKLRRWSEKANPTERLELEALFEDWNASKSLKDLESSFRLHRAKRLGEEESLILAGFELGMTLCSDLFIGAFDTHGAHLARHSLQLGVGLSRVFRILSRLDEIGLLDSTLVMVSSEMGRTPFYGSVDNPTPYNRDGGKDHFVDSSVFFFGGGIDGGRRLGVVDEWLNAGKVDFETLTASESGEFLKWAHIHGALRGLFSVKPEFETENPLPVKVPKIFKKSG